MLDPSLIFYGGRQRKGDSLPAKITLSNLLSLQTSDPLHLLTHSNKMQFLWIFDHFRITDERFQRWLQWKLTQKNHKKNDLSLSRNILVTKSVNNPMLPGSIMNILTLTLFFFNLICPFHKFQEGHLCVISYCFPFTYLIWSLQLISQICWLWQQ